jgi:CMP-N,N'-diacetyllegionaminic acid synthase
LGGFGLMIAIIPARGGSKGVPKKNIKIFNGYPLIYWTIKEALSARNITKVIVSTDSKEIADIAVNFGADVPFLRPKELAEDNSIAIDAYIFTIDKLINEYSNNIESFTVLQPTSPLRISEDIDGAIDLFNRMNADSVLSYTEAEHPIQWLAKINNKLKITNYFNSEDDLKNRQEFEKTYRPNGAVYVFNYEFIKMSHNYVSENTFAYIMPLDRSVDIDTEFDFDFAEYLIKRRP